MQTKKTIHIILIFVVFGFLLTASSLHSQIIYDRPASGNIQVVYSHWSLKDDSATTKINQLTIPFNGFIPIRDNFEARLYIANASNSLTYLNSDSSLSGLSDFRIQVNRSFYDDQFLISAGMNLPTGKKKLNLNEERAIINLLSENYLSFPMRRFGEGFGVNLLVGGATRLGSIRCGAGMMYQYNGSYKPYEDEEKYDPGDFFSISVSADAKTDKVSYSADLIFSGYVADKLDGEKIFKQSPQFDLRLGGVYGSGQYDLHGGIRYIIRGRNTRYIAESGAILEQLKIFGNEFSASAKAIYHPAGVWYFAPSVEMRLIAANEQDFGNSSILGFGGALGRKIGESFQFDLGFKYFTGSADGGDIDLSGFQISSNLMASF